MMSPAVMLVDQSDTEVERTAFPVERAGLVPMIVWPTCGRSVPEFVFHTSKVQVGLVPSDTIENPVMCPVYGEIAYATTPVEGVMPPPSTVTPNEPIVVELPLDGTIG